MEIKTIKDIEKLREMEKKELKEEKRRAQAIDYILEKEGILNWKPTIYTCILMSWVPCLVVSVIVPRIGIWAFLLSLISIRIISKTESKYDKRYKEIDKEVRN